VHVKHLKDTTGKRVIHERTGIFDYEAFEKVRLPHAMSRQTAFINMVIQPLVDDNTIGKEWLPYTNQMQCYETQLTQIKKGFKREADVQKLAPKLRPINTEKTPFKVALHCIPLLAGFICCSCAVETV
jgi:hypothetical protein